MLALSLPLSDLGTSLSVFMVPGATYISNERNSPLVNAFPTTSPVSESALRFEFFHTLLQMKSIPLGTT